MADRPESGEGPGRSAGDGPSGGPGKSGKPARKGGPKPGGKPRGKPAGKAGRAGPSDRTHRPADRPDPTIPDGPTRGTPGDWVPSERGSGRPHGATQHGPTRGRPPGDRRPPDRRGRPPGGPGAGRPPWDADRGRPGGGPGRGGPRPAPWAGSDRPDARPGERPNPAARGREPYAPRPGFGGDRPSTPRPGGPPQDRGPWRPPGGPPPDRGPWRPPSRGGPPADRGPWRPAFRERPTGPPGAHDRPAGPREPWLRPPRPDPAEAWPRRAESMPAPELLGPDEELVAGRRPVEEVFAAGRVAHRLLVVPQRRNALEQLVLHATRLRIPIVEVEGGSLTAIAGFDGHQGVALVVEPRRFASIADVLARAEERGEAPFVLVLDSLEDPQNVGTLLRSAEAAGVHGVVFPTRRQAPLSAAAVKASAGATEHLLLCPVDDLPGALADLHAHGLRIAGSEADAPLTARQTDLRGPLAIVVGSEGQGLGPTVRRRCDLFMRIPMQGRIGSLNAAVAGSVLLFEAVAQRDPAGTRSTASGTARPSETATSPATSQTTERIDDAPADHEAAQAPEAAQEPEAAQRARGRPGARARPGSGRGHGRPARRGHGRPAGRGRGRTDRRRLRARRRGPPARRSGAGRSTADAQAESTPHATRLTHPPGRPYHSPAPKGSSAVWPCPSCRRSSIGRAAVL